MRVLVVEDEEQLAAFIKQGLTEASFAVDVAGDGERALDLLGTTAYDAIVLDVMLPGMNGTAVCERIRSQGVETPVLMLSARRDVDDRVRGLDAGADDYLTKPFSFTELVARIRALLRRKSQQGTLILRVADVELDLVGRSVRRAGRTIDMTRREFALLEYLMRNAGRVMTRAMIAEHVWDVSWDRMTNVIDVFVSQLRHKLEARGEPRLLQAVRGVGYVMREPPPDDD